MKLSVRPVNLLALKLPNQQGRFDVSIFKYEHASIEIHCRRVFKSNLANFPLTYISKICNKRTSQKNIIRIGDEFVVEMDQRSTTGGAIGSH